MVLAPFDPSNKYFHHDIIYEDTAISLGIIDKIEGNPWFVKYRATLKDGSIIVYYKINYINGRYPWGEESFHDIIKGFIKEAENNVLFTYNPDDFNKCVDQIKEFLEDCKAKGIDSEFIENGIYVVNAFEVGEGMMYKETSNYDAHDIEKYNAQKDILKMLEDMLESKIDDLTDEKQEMYNKGFEEGKIKAKKEAETAKIFSDRAHKSELDRKEDVIESLRQSNEELRRSNDMLQSKLDASYDRIQSMSMEVAKNSGTRIVESTTK